jgi:hypothetical protein
MIRFERMGLIIPLVFLVVSHSLVNICSGVEEHGPSDQLRLLIEIDKNVYAPEERILLKCRIENGTKTTAFLHPLVRSDIDIFLKHESQQHEVPLGSRMLGTQMIRKEDIIIMPAGASFAFELSIIKDWYFNVPREIGKYQLDVIYKNRMESVENMRVWTGELKSNIVEFQIK